MVRLFVAGDICVKHSSFTFDDELKKMIKESEISICNFEAPVQSNGKPIQKSGPSHFQNALVPSILEETGFNAIGLANNHIMDYGDEGLAATIQTFSNATLFGAGHLDEAYSVASFTIKGIKIGLLSACQYEFGIVDEEIKGNRGVAWINSFRLRQIVTSCKKDFDYLFLFPHAGIENIDAPLPEWREVYKEYIELGIDGVFASHPHAPQGWEYYKGKPIFYSLGNFIFDKDANGRKYWNNGLVLLVNINESTREIVVEVKCTVFHDLHVAIDHSKQAEEHIQYVNHLLEDEKMYNNYITGICKKSYKTYSYRILRSMGVVPINTMSFSRFLKLCYCSLFKKGNKKDFLNTIRCESHRWLLQRCLNMNCGF